MGASHATATPKGSRSPLPPTGCSPARPCSTTGKLTATELIAESGLRRDVVYEHDKASKIVENFSARVKARNAVPEAMQYLAEGKHRLQKELEETRAALVQERGKTKVLLRVASELSLELNQARDE